MYPECDDCKMNQEDRMLADDRSMELEVLVAELEELLDETREELLNLGGFDPVLIDRINRMLPERSAS